MEGSVQIVNMESEEAIVLIPDIVVSDQRNVHFSGGQNEDSVNLSEDEKIYWRETFNNLDLLDNKKDGAVSIPSLTKVLLKLEDRENIFFFRRHTTRKINRNKLMRELSDLDSNDDGYVTLEELYEYLRRNKRLDYQRSHSKEGTMLSLIEYLKIIGNARRIKKWPPPLIIPSISLLVIIIHITCQFYPEISSILSFDSFHRNQIWRYLSYSLVHRDVEHIVANLLLLLCLGLVLEMGHGYWRVGLVFLSGVLAGSLSAYCFDPDYGLIGCSGGVYSVTVAQLATLCLNWKEDNVFIIGRMRVSRSYVHACDGKGLRALELLTVSLLIVGDVSWSVYKRYDRNSNDNVSYVAHVMGAMTGLMVGLLVLKNRIEEPWEKKMKLVLLPLVIILFAVAIVWNIFF